MDGVERLYHEIMCPTLTKKGPCNCQPVIVADTDSLCGCGHRGSLHHVDGDLSVYCLVASLRQEITQLRSELANVSR